MSERSDATEEHLGEVQERARKRKNERVRKQRRQVEDARIAAAQAAADGEQASADTGSTQQTVEDVKKQIAKDREEYQEKREKEGRFESLKRRIFGKRLRKVEGRVTKEAKKERKSAEVRSDSGTEKSTEEETQTEGA